MQDIKKRIQQGFHSSSGTTEEFMQFFRNFSSKMRKVLKSMNAQDVTIKKGHFYVFGFFSVNGNWFYFSLADVRMGIQNYTFMVRAAKSNTDYTGGINNNIPLDANFDTNLKKFVESPHLWW